MLAYGDGLQLGTACRTASLYRWAGRHYNYRRCFCGMEAGTACALLHRTSLALLAWFSSVGT